MEAIVLKPVCKSVHPAVWCAIGGGPKGGMGVEVANQKGGYLVVEFL